MEVIAAQRLGPPSGHGCCSDAGQDWEGSLKLDHEKEPTKD
jgi:hypothetical protein